MRVTWVHHRPVRPPGGDAVARRGDSVRVPPEAATFTGWNREPRDVSRAAHREDQLRLEAPGGVPTRAAQAGTVRSREITGGETGVDGGPYSGRCSGPTLATGGGEYVQRPALCRDAS